LARLGIERTRHRALFDGRRNEAAGAAGGPPGQRREIGFHGEALARELGVILLLCTLLYAAPPTALLGAILLTGYLGGAVASHLRVGDPLLTHVLSGVYAGLLVWGGLYLRDARLRALFPLH
jgi:DoxX-like family